MSVEARNGYRYFVTFTDDYSRYGYLYLMRHKSETFEQFKEFRHKVELQLGKIVKAIRSDRSGKYLSCEFEDYLRDCGIVSQWFARWWVKRICQSHFWGFAPQMAAPILNRVPSKSVENTPYEIWHGMVPSLYYLKIWDCEAYIRNVYLWSILKKQEDTTFTCLAKTRFSWLDEDTS